MSRMTVFHHASNEAGYVAAVIHEDDCHVFYGLGFVGSVDHVEPYEPSDETAALHIEIDQLKQRLNQTSNHEEVVSGMQAEIDQLKQQLAAAVQVKTDAPTTDTGGAAESKQVKKKSEA
ncbi:TPA: hypothetical protein ACP41M_001077 [Klebsiella aerogenes]